MLLCLRDGHQHEAQAITKLRQQKGVERIVAMMTRFRHVPQGKTAGVCVEKLTQQPLRNEVWRQGCIVGWENTFRGGAVRARNSRQLRNEKKHVARTRKWRLSAIIRKETSDFKNRKYFHKKSFRYF